MSLNKRLKDLCENYVDNKVDFSGYVEAIKQTFIDEGWRLHLAENVVVIPRKDMMTGPEWLARFEKEYRMIDLKFSRFISSQELSDKVSDAVGEAARRAAGVDHE